MDSDDNLYDRPIGTIGKRNLDKKRDDFLKKYITLIMGTKIVSGTTKIYIKSTLPSVASVIASHNQTLDEDEHINIKTAQSKVDYDTRKLLRYFPDNMITQVLSNSACDLGGYEKSYNHAVADYTKNKMLDNLKLRLPRTEIQDSLDEDTFERFIGMLAPYFVKHIKYLEDNLPANAVGYMQYLLSTPTQQLSGEHKKRYQILRDYLE